MELGKQDRRLLRLLQENGRISNQELAEAAGMSPSACWRRVRALEGAGVIKGYMAMLDARRCGMGFHAIVNVQLARHDGRYVDDFIRAITVRPEVLDCFATAGESDYHLRVRCTDLDAYNAFLDDFLFRLPGLQHVRTNLVMKEIKHARGVPI